MFSASPINNKLAVKVCNLPIYLNDQDVAAFFKGLNIIRGGISFLLNVSGQRYGQAYVKFEDTTQRDLALQRHGQYIAQNLIRVKLRHYSRIVDQSFCFIYQHVLDGSLNLNLF